MNRTTSLMILLVSVTMSFAQTTKELAKQQLELNAINMKLLDAKPTKSAKKEAKELKKEGWTVPAGEQSIEQQITASQLYGAELTTNEEGNTIKRFIMQTALILMKC